jgi:putative colanic acid biosynthesis acetyltransferase WcaF
METTEQRKKVDLSSFDNAWYNPGGPVKRVLWLMVNAVFFNHGLAVFNGIKVTLLRMFGARIGKNVLIKPSVSIKYPWLLTIGNNCWIGERVWIDNLAEVNVGDHVCLSQGSMLLTGNHDFRKRSFDLIIKPITLEDGVWIGAKSVVCPGVYAESHSILTVQSVVTTRMEAYTIYQGNPAKPVKTREVKN